MTPASASRRRRSRSGRDIDLAAPLEAVFRAFHRPHYAGLAPGPAGAGDRDRSPFDPVSFPRAFTAPGDREAVALLASALAFGRLAQIRATVTAVLDRMRRVDPSPGRFLRRFDPRRHRGVFSGIVHRWVRGEDLELFLWRIARVAERHGGLERALLHHDRPDEPTLEAAIAGWRSEVYAEPESPYAEGPGARYLLPDPAGGSACKRIHLFLRWMVRPDDGIDLGLWRRFPPRRLVVPLDTHIHRIGLRLRWTHRRTATWAAAEDITRALARFDPDDPVRFDFALCRMGALGFCPARPDPANCGRCGLAPHCVEGHGRSGSRPGTLR